MPEDTLQTISKKLSILIALTLKQDEKSSMKDHIRQLSRFGLSTGEIAEVLGTTPGTVAVARSQIKKKG